MLSSLIILISASVFPYAFGWKEQCEGFEADSIPNVKAFTSIYYPAGSLVNTTSFWSPLSTSDLPAFCIFKFNVLTNPATGKTAGSELWLPDDWNSRMLAFGGGGWSGGGKWGRSKQYPGET
jgi:feruloyl esterase